MKFKLLAVSGLIFLNLMISVAVFMPHPVSAAVDPSCSNSLSFLGFPTWFKYLDVGRKETKNKEGVVISIDECAVVGPTTTNPKDGTQEFDWSRASGRILLAIFEIILRIAGIAAVIFVIYGGFQYILSQGEPDRLKGARSTIVNALIGLAIAVSATAIVNLIGKNIT